MNIQNQVKEILVEVFLKTSTKYKVPVQEVELMFLLADSENFKCKYGQIDISLNIAGLKAQMFSGSINKFIVKALSGFSERNNIPKNKVNVAMRYVPEILGAGNNPASVIEITMTLRTGFDIIRPITIEELLK